jgi:hypothetical protein
LERGDVDLATIPEADERLKVVRSFRFMYWPSWPLTIDYWGRAALDDGLCRRAALVLTELCSREWLQSACHVSRIRPNIIFESAAPQTLARRQQRRRHCGGTTAYCLPRKVAPSRLLIAVPIGGGKRSPESATFYGSYARFVELVYTRANYPNRDNYATRAAHAAKIIDMSVGFGLAV